MVHIKTSGLKEEKLSYLGNFHHPESLIIQVFWTVKIFLSLLFLLEYLIKATHSLEVLEVPG